MLACLLACVHAGVLQAFNTQVTANVGLNRLASDDGAFERRVAPALQAQRVARLDARDAVSDVLPVALAPGRAGRDRYAHAARACAHAHRAGAAFVAAFLAGFVARRQQRDAVVCNQISIAPGADARALHGQVAVLPGAGRADAHVAARSHARAPGAAALACSVALAGARPDA